MCNQEGAVFCRSFQEGPHSALNEDEFFDALEMAYQFGESEHVSSCVQDITGGEGGGGGGGCIDLGIEFQCMDGHVL